MRSWICVGILWFVVPAGAAPGQKDWLADLKSARDEHTTEVKGWLKLVGLDSLHTGDNVVGTAPESQVHLPAPAPGRLAVLRLEPNGHLLLLPPPGAEAFPDGLNVNGHPPATAAGPPARGLAIALHSDLITWRSLSLRLFRSGSGYAMRVWDDNSADLRSFHGLHWYDPDPRYRVNARFVEYPSAKLLSIANGDGTSAPLPSPGYAEFAFEGSSFRLYPVYPAPGAKQLRFAFRDATAVRDTYGAGRFLFTDPPKGGRIELDFNRAENPACAYNPYTVCPLPPRENRLTASIRAGEKKYHE